MLINSPRCSAHNLIRTAIFLTILCLPASASAQSRVEYEISFPNAVHHEAEVTALFLGVPPERPLQVRMSRSSPGRYALHEFAKNVYNVKAFDGRGVPLTVTRPNPYQWDIHDHNGTVRVTYTLFGDDADGTYVGIDNTHAHLNMPAAFMWARGLEQAPIRITFHKPVASWRIATQLVPTSEESIFTAPNLQYFMDSPTEISDFTLRQWSVHSGERTYTIRLAVHHAGTETEVDAFAEMAQKVVAEQIAMFGEAPAFDYGTYTFIACYLPHVVGDGMEHRNSTILTSPRPLSQEPKAHLRTLSHEFFHAWNVERIRPRSLEPFNFEEANMSGELWFAEGFTSYFADLFIRRAGIITDEEYAAQLSSTLSLVVNSPGRRFFSAVEMSLQAPFVDGSAAVDLTNRQNTYLSYYSWGSAIALGLDLTLRARFPAVTLEDYLRALWQEHGKVEKPYTLTDLKGILGRITGDLAFAQEFFQRYIEGKEVVDYERLLGQAGFLLRKTRPHRAWLGAELRERAGAVIVAEGTLVGSPLYRAGLDRGDHIISLDGKTIKKVEDVKQLLEGRKAGEIILLEFEQRGEKKRASVELAEDPQLEVVTYEKAGRPVTDEMRKFRNRWLGSRLR